MIQYDETRLAMEALTPQIEELKGALNLEGLKIKVDELEMKSTEPKFWDDPEKAQAVQQQIGQYKNTIDSFNRMKTNHDDVLAMIELAEEENDESAVDEVKELAEKVKSEFEEQKLATLLTGEYDSSNAILTFHAGAGGTEAQDWVSMLLRMYMKWADRPRLQDRDTRYARRRRSRNQERFYPYSGLQRIRISEVRKRRAQAGARFSVRRPGPQTHQLRQRRGYAGDRKGCFR